MADETQAVQWVDLRYQESVAVDPTGKVVGGVVGAYGHCVASAAGKMIGVYLTDDYAKQAVERALTPSLEKPLGPLPDIPLYSHPIEPPATAEPNAHYGDEAAKRVMNEIFGEGYVE